MKKKQKNKTKTKERIILTLCVVGPIILGILTNDLIIGGSLLATSLLSSYLAAIYRRSNYIYGAICALLIAYTAYLNNFFGSVIVNALIFMPIELYGFFAWSRNLDSNKNVKTRKFSFRTSIVVVSTCTIGSFVFGYLLTKIPGQNLAFLDSTIWCLDLCALVLLNMRYGESWWIWTLSGVLSTIMWAVALASGGESALMRLFTASCFIVINACGLFNWNYQSKTKR